MSVDLRSRSEMTAFLEHHFRYPTMNSWNQSVSYACNVKIYKLGLTSETENKLYELMETQEFFVSRRELLDEFGAKHEYRWQAAMNGRNGGYLVLYQGERKPSGYKSYCTCCGQLNYRDASDSDNVCGRCRTPARENFSTPHMQVTVFPGRGTDDDTDFEGWTMDELKARVRLVQELDQLADRLVDRAIYLAKNYTVEEEEYLVPQTRKVLVSAV